MRKMKSWIAISTILFLLMIAAAGCGLFPNDADADGGEGRFSGDPTAPGDPIAPGDPGAPSDPDIGEDEQTMPAWVPFAIDSYPEMALEGFLYKGTPVQAASVREAVESGDNVTRITEQIKEKLPHYPFEQIPLIEPDMLVSSSEKAVGDDISISVSYYTKSGFEEALEFYRNALEGFDRYEENKYESDAGTTYDLSFAAEVEGGFHMDAGVMVMQMPESTGYECSIYFQGAIRDAAKEEDEPVGIREDGVPENFPDDIVPMYKAKEIDMAEGDSDYCWVQFSSRATYRDAVEFYRTELSAMTDFNESDETEGEVWFYCLAPGWSIEVCIYDSEGRAYITINCYAE